MKKLLLVFVLFNISFYTFAWGQNGHRIVGLIAESHLRNSALKNIKKVLGHYTLAEVSNFMDVIKSDTIYSHMSPWHYATIPEGQTYADVGTPVEGDIIKTIERLISELKSKRFSDGDEAFALKCLIHLIGDIHQPLHIGNGLDRGGNDIKVKYFGEKTNLHRVWDTQIIEKQHYSYTEYVEWINHPSNRQKKDWSSMDVLDWANESKKYREQCYHKIPESKELGYGYNYANLALLNQRLLQGGIRLSNVLNEIYG